MLEMLKTLGKSVREYKKFAIINMLFMGKHSLKNRTVLLLTHEFNTVIDAIYNIAKNQKIC